MESFGSGFYVPVLMAKAGEFRALETLDGHKCSRLRPIFVVPPPEKSFRDDRPQRTLTEHLNALTREFALRWTRGDAFVDLRLVEAAAMPTGEHALEWLIEVVADVAGTRLTPVINSASSISYVSAVARVLKRYRHGLCVRWGPADFGQPEWPAKLLRLVHRMGCDPAETHLIVDLGIEIDSDMAKDSLAALRAIPNIEQWASVTWSGTGMPSNMPTGGSTIHTVARPEWRFYEALMAMDLHRSPSFGDYAVHGPSKVLDLDPALMTQTATLRYSLPGKFLVSKGLLYKAPGGKGLGKAAVPPAAVALCRHPEVLTADHCMFDSWLLGAARAEVAGNSTTWRMLGTLHHVTLTLEQIATLHAP